jgi:hypothetical protein
MAIEFAILFAMQTGWVYFLIDKLRKAGFERDTFRDHLEVSERIKEKLMFMVYGKS